VSAAFAPLPLCQDAHGGALFIAWAWQDQAGRAVDRRHGKSPLGDIAGIGRAAKTVTESFSEFFSLIFRGLSVRPSSPHQRRDIKARTWALLDNLGISEFVPITRVKHAALSKYGAPPKGDGDPLQAEDQYIPIDVLLDAELRAGPMVTKLVAELQGYKLVPKDEDETRAGKTVSIAAVLRASKECADVTSAYLERSADGDLDRQDRREICREIDEAIAELTSLRKQVG
jgi:hypothetical protein